MSRFEILKTLSRGVQSCFNDFMLTLQPFATGESERLSPKVQLRQALGDSATDSRTEVSV